MRPRTLLPLLLPVVLGLVLAACGGTSDGGATDLPTDAATSSGGDAAGGTTVRVYTVEEVLAADVQSPVHVSGLLIDDGSGWRLCHATLESYPVQCGQPALQVEGVNEAEFEFQEAQGVRWVEGATLVGDVEDGTLTVTGSAATS